MAKVTKPPAGRRATEAAGEKLYYRIGEVSRITGVKPYVLRYWESEFRWMAPGKSRSQQRLYRQRDIDVILLIKKLLYDERFTIAGARKRLRELGVAGASTRDAAPLETAAPPPAVAIDDASGTIPADARARLSRIRAELVAIRALL